MVNWAICFILSVLISYGISVALVEKGREWPVKRYRVLLQWGLSKVYWKAAWVLFCVACTSFWVALVVDVVLRVGVCGAYWGWPLSGFGALGFSWTVIEALNSLDRAPQVYIHNREDDGL